MNDSPGHLLTAVMVTVAFLSSLARSSGAILFDTSASDERGQRTEEEENERCVVFRVGGMMKAKSGAT